MSFWYNNEYNNMRKRRKHVDLLNYVNWSKVHETTNLNFDFIFFFKLDCRWWDFNMAIDQFLTLFFFLWFFKRGWKTITYVTENEWISSLYVQKIMIVCMFCKNTNNQWNKMYLIFLQSLIIFKIYLRYGYSRLK